MVQYVRLRFFCPTSKGGHSEPFLLFEFCCGTPPSCLKVVGWWVVVVAYSILVSAQGPLVLVLGLKGLGIRVWGQGFTKFKHFTNFVFLFTIINLTHRGASVIVVFQAKIVCLQEVELLTDLLKQSPSTCFRLKRTIL